MQGEIIVAGHDEDALLEEVMRRLKLPREALSVDVEVEDESELLPGAKPQVELRVRIRPEYVADLAYDHLDQLLRIIDMPAEITQEIRNGIIFIQVHSKEAASLLIGRDGQNLDALQYLINRMSTRVGREAPMIVIDVENYRLRQFERLERLADRAVARARETGNEIELNPMAPLDRKYLHHYLHDIDDISTFSRGDEPDRYLVIVAD